MLNNFVVLVSGLWSTSFHKYDSHNPFSTARDDGVLPDPLEITRKKSYIQCHKLASCMPKAFMAVIVLPWL